MREYTRALIAYLNARREYDALDETLPGYREMAAERMDKAEAALLAACDKLDLLAVLR
jgi:hypothetical protein